jgi:transposase InsO family protein
LCLAIAEHGPPRALRTDNESMFTSRLWAGALKLAGIGHQRIAPKCPWQNGRIERFFGTLKPVLRQLVLPTSGALQGALDEFAGFYNHARAHQGLSGLILIRIRNCINNPIPIANRLNALSVTLHACQAVHQLILQSVQAVKGTVVKALLA